MRPTRPELIELLRCPVTGAGLEEGDGRLVARDDDREYPVVRGVPVLLDASRSLFDPGGYLDDTADAGRPRISRRGRLFELAKRIARLGPRNSRNVGSDHNYRHLHRLLTASATKRPRLLVVGGQIPGVGAIEILDAPDLLVVETDVAIGPRTQVVCDGHDLPFADGQFDGVICQAVLEHVVDPYRVASEIHRVLRSGGFVYSEVPFMQQVHGGAYDFTRFTLLGHRRLWRWFEEIDSGAQGGPGMALGWSIQYFGRSFPRSRIPARIIERLLQIATAWLTVFDPLLVRRPGGLDAASGTFFLGRRLESPVSDKQVIESFRGLGAAAPAGGS